jgi:hypothetical protein
MRMDLVVVFLASAKEEEVSIIKSKATNRWEVRRGGARAWQKDGLDD